MIFEGLCFLDTWHLQQCEHSHVLVLGRLVTCLAPLKIRCKKCRTGHWTNVRFLHLGFGLSRFSAFESYIYNNFWLRGISESLTIFSVEANPPWSSHIVDFFFFFNSVVFPEYFTFFYFTFSMSTTTMHFYPVYFLKSVLIIM